MRDYYAILGVSEQASPQQIKRAFRKLCMQYHPDKTGGSRTLEEKFRLILAAYEVLGDPNRKHQYDQRIAWQRAAAAAATHRPPPAQVNYNPPPAPVQHLPWKIMLYTGGGLLLFFVLLYLFGPLPKDPNAPDKNAVSPAAPVFSTLFPQAADENPYVQLPGEERRRLNAFFTGGDTTRRFVNMDNDDIPELVAGGYLFAATDGETYRPVFHYDGAMYVQQNLLYLYFNDLLGAYRSCYRCTVAGLPNDEPIAEIRMVYDSGRVVFPEHDKYRSIAILENLQHLFQKGIPIPDKRGYDDGTRKELLRHFIAYHFNQHNPALTKALFERLYTEPDKDTVWRDLAGMIAVLEKRITSAAAAQ